MKDFIKKLYEKILTYLKKINLIHYYLLKLISYYYVY